MIFALLSSVFFSSLLIPMYPFILLVKPEQYTQIILTYNYENNFPKNRVFFHNRCIDLWTFKSLDSFIVNLYIAAFNQETSHDTFHRKPGFKFVLPTFFIKGLAFSIRLSCKPHIIRSLNYCNTYFYYNRYFLVSCIDCFWIIKMKKKNKKYNIQILKKVNICYKRSERNSKYKQYDFILVKELDMISNVLNHYINLH